MKTNLLCTLYGWLGSQTPLQAGIRRAKSGKTIDECVGEAKTLIPRMYLEGRDRAHYEEYLPSRADTLLLLTSLRPSVLLPQYWCFIGGPAWLFGLFIKTTR